MPALLPPAYLLLHPSFSSSSLYMEGESSHGRPFSPPESRMSSLPSSFPIVPSHIFILSLPWLILLMLKVKDGRHFSVSTHILAPFFIREAIRSWNMSPLPSTREWLDKSEQKVLKFENVPDFPRRIVWNRLLGSLVSITKMESKNLYFSSKLPMAPHSSTLAWKMPRMEEPGRLQSMGSLRVGHDWATSLSLFTFMHWRRKWQPTPAFLPGESQGRGSPVGCHLWGHTVGHDWSHLAAAAAASSQEMLLV